MPPCAPSCHWSVADRHVHWLVLKQTMGSSAIRRILLQEKSIYPYWSNGRSSTGSFWDGDGITTKDFDVRTQASALGDYIVVEHPRDAISGGAARCGARRSSRGLSPELLSARSETGVACPASNRVWRIRFDWASSLAAASFGRGLHPPESHRSCRAETR
jgi:hypothetical protein